MLPTDHGAEYEMLGLKKQVFRGRTRSNKERDKMQLEGKKGGKGDKRGQLHINRLVVSTLVCPAPGHDSLFCLLINL